MADCNHPPAAVEVESFDLSLYGRFEDGQAHTKLASRISLVVACRLCKRMEAVHQPKTATKWALRGIARQAARDPYFAMLLRLVQFDLEGKKRDPQVWLSDQPPASKSPDPAPSLPEPECPGARSELVGSVTQLTLL
jgi:hypothetical protein